MKGIEMFKAEFNGLVASPSLWRALGAFEVYPYTNGHGPVRWHMEGSRVGTTESYALELLTRARQALPMKPLDESVVAKAVEIRGQDRSALALQELGRGLSSLAERGVSVTGTLRAQIEQVVSLLPSGEGASS
jgi:hypothetical protein